MTTTVGGVAIAGGMHSTWHYVALFLIMFISFSTFSLRLMHVASLNASLKHHLCTDVHDLWVGQTKRVGLLLMPLGSFRLFGLYNTPYVSGRKVDIVSEIVPVATDAVKQQITRIGGKLSVESEQCLSAPL
jgi:hypothetical protein